MQLGLPAHLRQAPLRVLLPLAALLLGCTTGDASRSLALAAPLGTDCGPAAIATATGLASVGIQEGELSGYQLIQRELLPLPDQKTQAGLCAGYIASWRSDRTGDLVQEGLTTATRRLHPQGHADQRARSFLMLQGDEILAEPSVGTDRAMGRRAVGEGRWQYDLDFVWGPVRVSLSCTTANAATAQDLLIMLGRRVQGRLITAAGTSSPHTSSTPIPHGKG